MKTDMRILGKNAVYSTDCSTTGLNNNIIVCGSSGSGKTMSISETLFLETYNSSLIANVSKRRIVKKYTKPFERRGYRTEEVNFSAPAESSSGFDPLRFIHGSSDITFISKSIVNANPKKEYSKADPYWDDAATSLLSSIIAYVLMVGDNPSFNDVLDVIYNIDFEEVGSRLVTSLDEDFEFLANRNPGNFAVSCWKTFHKLPIKTASCVFSTLNTTIDNIFSPEVRKLIEMKRQVDFKRLADERTVLFVSSSAVNPAIHSFVNLFYSIAFKELFEYSERLSDGKLPIPVHFLCDDFAVGGKILNFPEYISIFREKQISVTLLIQSESQLYSMYGDSDAQTIINNSDTYVYMGSMDPKTAQNISLRLDIPICDVLSMPLGQECIFRRGQKPVITTRYDIVNDKRYQQITQEYEKHPYRFR